MKKIICIALTAMALILTGSSARDAFCAGHGDGHGGGGYAGHGGGWHGGYGGHGDRVGVGVFVGPGWGGWGPWWWGSYYPYYPYYPYYGAPPVAVQQQPETYIQETPQAEEPSYWYFCPDPKGYYPYVKKCPKGWLKVVPSPTPGEEEE